MDSEGGGGGGEDAGEGKRPGANAKCNIHVC